MTSARTQINTEYSDVKFKSFCSSTCIMTSSSQNRRYIPLHKGEKSVHVSKMKSFKQDHLLDQVFREDLRKWNRCILS